MKKDTVKVLIGFVIISPLVGIAIFSSIKFSTAASLKAKVPVVTKFEVKKTPGSPRESWSKEWEVTHKSIPVSPTDEQPIPAF